MSVNGQDFREPVYWLNKVNLKTYTGATGTALAALSNIQVGKIYRCTSTGNGFVLNNYYMRNGDNTKWIIVYSIGGWQNIIAHSIQQGVFWFKYYPRKEDFIQQTSTGGTLTNNDSSGGIDISSSATTDGRAALVHDNQSCKVDWSRPAVMRAKFEFDDAKQVIARVGLHVSDYNTIPSNSEKQVGLEIDQTPDTDTFWSIISSDGVTKTTLLTSNNPVAGSNTYRYILEYIPNTAIKLYVNGLLIATKTTNLPNSGTTPNNQTFTAMVRSRHANNKTIGLRSLVLAFGNGNTY